MYAMLSSLICNGQKKMCWWLAFRVSDGSKGDKPNAESSFCCFLTAISFVRVFDLDQHQRFKFSNNINDVTYKCIWIGLAPS